MQKEPHKMDNSSLSEISTLDKQIAELSAKRAEILSQKRNETLAEIKTAIEQFKFSWEELGYIKKTRQMTEASDKGQAVWYQSPDDKNKIYKGKGPKPLWFKAYIDSGKPKEDLIYKM